MAINENDYPQIGLGSFNNIFVVEYVKTEDYTIPQSDTYFEISSSKEGYRPILFSSLGHNYSSMIMGTWQDAILQDGYFKLSGFARRMDSSSSLTQVRFRVYILWMKI